MIQIRNVPTKTHRRLKVLAAGAGMSLSEFLLREITSVAERPSLEELVGRIRARPRRDLGEDDLVARILREERGPLP